MYDLSKRFHKDNLSVGELIGQLSKLPQQAKICICGDDCCYIHIEQDGSVVNFDTEDLEDCYEEMVAPDPKEFEYGGYHFIPYGFFTKRENDDFKLLNSKLRTDMALGFFAHDDVAGRKQKYPYSYESFYTAAKDHTFDIFKCRENDKLYVPGENELFEYLR